LHGNTFLGLIPGKENRQGTKEDGN
jgi:hypothetical protein